MVLHPEQPAFAHALARLLAASGDERVRDGRRALELVELLAARQRTTDLSETAAMALAERGRYAEAVEWQRSAIQVATDAGEIDAAVRMAENLTLYEQGLPCRTPWHPDHPIHFPGPSLDRTQVAELFDNPPAR
jgi:hypothetical protein